MRITQISVQGLFDIFDHAISLNMADRVTIIHGPNGYGKTVMLQMIDGLLNSQYQIFTKVPFRSFRVDFDNGVMLRVEPRKGKSDRARRVVVYWPWRCR